MKYRRVGASGLQVSAVSLGSWLTYGNSVKKQAAKACLQAAIEGGVNFIDTADAYARGKAEQFLGKALRDYRRRNLVLGTKCFWPMSDDVNDQGLSRKHVVESCHASLKRLKTDYIDLFQCHRFDPNTPLPELVRTFDDLIRQGKVLYWGVSCWEPGQLKEVCQVADRMNAPRPISNQPPYSLLNRDIEAEVIPTSRELGLGQVVFSPLAEGVLTGKYLGGARPKGSRLADEKINRFIQEKVTPENLARVERLKKVADELGVPLATMALAWCLRDPSVACVIAGASRPEQVEANLAAAELDLTPDTLGAIDSALRGDG